MTITITKITKSQWGHVGKVILWLGVSAACAVAAAYISNNPVWLASMPGWNVLGVIIEQLLQQEEATALSNVPADVKSELDKVVPEIVKPTVTQIPVAEASAVTAANAAALATTPISEVTPAAPVVSGPAS